MKQKLKTTVTLREIEDAGPCYGEYFALLKDLKSNVIADGDYDGGECPEMAKKFKTPQFGADDPIGLGMLAKKKTKTSGTLDWSSRVAWLLKNLNSLDRTRLALIERVEKIMAEANTMAFREILGDK